MLAATSPDSPGIDWASTIGLIAGVLYLIQIGWSLAGWALRRLRGKVVPVGRKYGLLFLRLVAVVVAVGLLFVSDPTPTQAALAVALGVLGATDFVLSVRERRNAVQVVKPDTPTQASTPPTQAEFLDVLRLAEQFIKTSKVIYSFLNRHAMRSDEPKVLAEYRQKFDAKVMSLCLDLISAGLSDAERLKIAMTPPASVHDIQWVARILAIMGEGFGPRLRGFVQKAGGGTLVRTRRTNKGHFPRIESAVDSFGRKPEELATTLWIADGGGHELTPGDEVIFKVELSDPDGDDVFLSIIPPGGLDDDGNVPISADGTMTWTVRDVDVSDPAYVFILVRSQRELHRDSRGIDDSVGFVYRVVPRV